MVAAIAKRQSWAGNVPPRIDWSHPLSRGLLFCALPGVASVDLVSGISATRTGTVNHGSTKFGHAARAVTASTPTNFLDFGSAGSLNGYTNGSVTWVGSIVTLGTSILVSRWPNLGFLMFTSASTWRFQVNAGGVSTTATGPAAAAGDNAVITGVKNGTSLVAWANGVPGTAASCNAGAFGAGNSLRMFNKSDDSGTSGETAASLVLVHGRALSDVEVKMLAEDPFCILERSMSTWRASIHTAAAPSSGFTGWGIPL